MAGHTKLLFIINPGSGNKKINWDKHIQDFFSSKPFDIELFELPEPCKPEILKSKIDKAKASRVVAVGGDGTVKLVAECLLKTDIPLAILPAGSANGMARELGLSDDPIACLESTLAKQANERDDGD